MGRFRSTWENTRKLYINKERNIIEKPSPHYVKKDKNERHLIPGYTESVIRKHNQSNLNRQLKGKPVTLPTLSIQDDN